MGGDTAGSEIWMDMSRTAFWKSEADTVSAKALRCVCLAWLRMSKESREAGEK